MGDVIEFDIEKMARALVNKEVELDAATWAQLARTMRQIRAEGKGPHRYEGTRPVSIDRVKRKLLNTLRMQADLLLKRAAREELFDKDESQALVNYLRLMEKFEDEGIDFENMSVEELEKLAKKK